MVGSSFRTSVSRSIWMMSTVATCAVGEWYRVSSHIISYNLFIRENFLFPLIA